jgi:hypothetical protein
MKSDCHTLGDSRNQETAKQNIRRQCIVSLREDKEERKVEIADDISSIFNKNQEAKTIFDKMSYTQKRIHTLD